MTTHQLAHAHAPATAARPTPTDRLLTASLVVAPLLYLAADATYAAKGWDDADAGLIHVLGAIAYAFVLVRIATWAAGWLAASTLFVGIVGACGNVAYGFNTIHVSLGGQDLVDAAGAATIIKPLGLLCPLAFLVAAVVLLRLERRAAALLVGLGGVVWPVAHIGNIAWLAVTDNVLLVLGLVPLAFGSMPRPTTSTTLDVAAATDQTEVSTPLRRG